MLDRLSEFAPVIPQKLCSLEGIGFISKLYLSGYDLKIWRVSSSYEKFHLVEEVHQWPVTGFCLHVMKTISYVTLIFPLIAAIALIVSARFPSQNIYYFENRYAHESYFIDCASDPSRLNEMKALYLFDKTVLRELDKTVFGFSREVPQVRSRSSFDSKQTAFMTACNSHNFEAINWLHEIDPTILHEEVRQTPSKGTAFFQACEKEDAQIIKYLYNLDQNVLFYKLQDLALVNQITAFGKLCKKSSLDLIRWVFENATEMTKARIKREIQEIEFYTGVNGIFRSIYPGISREKIDYLYSL